ncbi:hypothetical protein ACSF86_01120 [Moraxella bovoculi]|uniref:hypothetical protein n=1 Tax=Moraxella bovoculi TaxID=386891 RepID=UPI003F4F78BE
MEFIRVSDALKRLNSALEEISQDGHIKTLLNKYRFLEMNLYVSNDNGESIVKANELQEEIYYDFMNRQISDKNVFVGLLSAMQKLHQGITPFILNETMRFKEKYYWRADDFYGNSLFKKLEIKNGGVVYYSANLNEEDLERLADKALKNKIAELEQQLQAKDSIIGALSSHNQSLVEMQNASMDDQELRPNSKNTVSKLLYALMMQADFELDGTKQGNLNDRLVSLTKEYGVPVNGKFITSWLEYLNDKYYFTKGK